MNRLLIGNIVSLVASIIAVLIGFIKEQRKTLIVQLIDFVLLATANLILNGISGVITNVVSFIRNLICLKFKFNTALKVIFMAIQAVLIYFFNSEGIFAIFPFLAVLILTVFIDAKNIKVFKASISVSQVFWIIYDLSIINISSFIFDTMLLITNTVTLYKIAKNK